MKENEKLLIEAFESCLNDENLYKQFLIKETSIFSPYNLDSLNSYLYTREATCNDIYSHDDVWKKLEKRNPGLKLIMQRRITDEHTLPPSLIINEHYEPGKISMIYKAKRIENVTQKEIQLKRFFRKTLHFLFTITETRRVPEFIIIKGAISTTISCEKAQEYYNLYQKTREKVRFETDQENLKSIHEKYKK